MKLIVFTKEDSPEMHQANEIGKELEKDGSEVEFLDLESAEGSSKADIYDVYSAPTFLVVREDGSLVNIWRGYIPPRQEISQQINL